MEVDFKTYLENISFEKYLQKLIKKTKNDPVVIYGAGSFFKFIHDNYDLSKLNIIGISDMKFTEDMENDDYLGYKIIPRSQIKKYNPKYVLVATLEYIGIVEGLTLVDFEKTNIKVYPLAKMPLLDLIKKIWNR